MDFLRFSSSQRYATTLPLRSLSFRVTVSRALMVEENKPEMLCCTDIPFDAKLLSPNERLASYEVVRQALGNLQFMNDVEEGGEGGGFFPHSGAAGVFGGGASSYDASGLHALMDRTGTIPDLQATTDAIPAAAAASSGPRLPNSPTSAGYSTIASVLRNRRELVQQLRQPEASLFTRPSTEDYIDLNDENGAVVEPSHWPSRLAPVILRQHRKDHQPNRNMFLMWDSGHLEVPEEEAADASTGGGGWGPLEVLRFGGRPGTGGNNPASGDLRWHGHERVMCTITSERSEFFFSAKPSLNQWHTLMVDSLYIYSFKVEALTVSSPGTAYGDVAQLISDDVRVLAAEVAAKCESMEGTTRGTMSRLWLKGLALIKGVTTTAAATTAGDGAGTKTSSSPSSWVLEAEPTRETMELIGAAAAHTTPFAGAGGGGRGRAAAKMDSSSATFVRPVMAPGMCRYHIFGTVERCLGLPYRVAYLRCELMHDVPPEYSRGGRPGFEPQTLYTQLSYAGELLVDDFMWDVDHTFNLPFECAFVDFELPPSPLRLIVTAYSGAAGTDEATQSIVGYTSITLPIASPGHHQLHAPMWAPHMTGHEYVKSAIIGGAPTLVNPRSAGPPEIALRTGVAVREGLHADTVGEVMVNLNIVRQRRVHEGKN